MELSNFLLARIGETEAAARAVGEGQWEVYVGQYETEVLLALRPGLPLPPEPSSGNWAAVCGWSHDELAQCQISADEIKPVAGHIARHDPPNVLAECAALRQLVEHVRSVAEDPCEYSGWVWFAVQTWRLLALPYRDHPDWQVEWEPYEYNPWST